MKLQQICRFRLGVQERNSGYQTCGVSDGITTEMEDEFADKVKTIKIYPKDEDRLPVLEWSYSQTGKVYYLICVSRGEDALSRLTPLPHGIIIDEENAEALLNNPEKFMAFSNTNFIYDWDAKDLNKKRLPELSGLALDTSYHFSMAEIQRKYQLSDEQFKRLLYHIYEIVLSDGTIESFSFIWDGPKASYIDVMRDMMYVVYSSVPVMLKSRISFASDKLNGMLTRMFTVANSAERGSWFNLNTGESSSLQEINEDNCYRLAFVEYLAEYAGTADAAELLEWIDEFAQRIYRRPDMKRGAALTNVMSAAFLTWRKEIAQQYFKPSQLIRVAHSMVILRADDREFLDDKIGEILQQAVMKGGKINNIQQDNMQKLYVTTGSVIYRNAYQMAVALKDQESVFKCLISTLKEESNEVTDNFIAFLLTKLPKTPEVQTQEVIDGLSKRYYVTDNEDLQKYYLEYVESKYNQELSNEDIDAMILPAFENLKKQEQETKAYERASRYLQYQVNTLLQKKRKASDTVLEKMAAEYDKLPQGELTRLIFRYALDCYLFRSEDEAVEYYEKLRTIGGPLFSEINFIFYDTENSVLDLHFVRKLYPRMEPSIVSQISAMEKVVKFPVWEKSCQAILDTTSQLCIDRMKKEAAAFKKESGTPLSEYLHDVYVSIDRQLVELNQISGNKISSQVNEIREKCKRIYWDFMEVGAKTRNCLKYTELYCDHPNCRKIYEFYEILDELKNKVSMGQFDLSESSIKLLTTNAFIEKAERRNHLIKKYLIDSVQEYQKPSIEIDGLLVMNYDNVKGKFSNTAFFKDMTKEQWEQLEMGSIMLQLHPDLSAEVEAYQKKASRSNLIKKIFKNPKARIGVLAAVIVILLAGGTVIALKVIGGDKSNNDGTQAFVPTNESVMNPTASTDPQAGGTLEGNTSESNDEEGSSNESSTEESGSSETSGQESSGESSGADMSNTFSEDEYSAAFMVDLDGYQYGLENNYVHNLTNGSRRVLANNGKYTFLKTDGIYLYCVKDDTELRRYDNPGADSLYTDTMKRASIEGGAGRIAFYEVVENGTIYMLTSNDKVYSVNLEEGSEPVQILEQATSIAYDNGNLYAAWGNSVYCYASDNVVQGNEINTWVLPENPNEIYVENGIVGYLVSGTFYIYNPQESRAEACVQLDTSQQYCVTDGYLYGIMKKAGTGDESKEGRFDLSDHTISWIAE